MHPIVVTGASGFVGRALVPMLPGAHSLAFGAPDWRERLAAAPLGSATIYHLAARVHRAGDRDEAGYVTDNVEKTEALARAAAGRGARALVFASTIKVAGEETHGAPFRASDPPAPADAYARSKLAAERVLAAIARETGLAVQILRPPLIYGPRAAGNLAALVRLCDSPVPLPFLSIRNRRSFLAVDDFARALLAAAAHARAGTASTWHVAHPQPVATPELAAALRDALGRARRLVPMPPALLEGLASAAGRRELARRLTRSLEVDATPARDAWGWTARTSLHEVAKAIVAGHRAGALA